MQFLHDNIIASIIAGGILLTLALLQIRGQQANVQAGQFYVNRVQSLGFLEVLQRDFANIGAGVQGTGQSMIVEHAWSGTTKRFEFRAVVDTTAGAPVQQVRYELTTSTDPVCTSQGVTCYQVRRLIRQGTTYVETGRSHSTLTEFDVQLFPAGATLANVREVGVRMSAMSPMGEDKIVRRSTFETRFRPLNLAFQDA
jgi:hypothetical protein